VSPNDYITSALHRLDCCSNRFIYGWLHYRNACRKAGSAGVARSSKIADFSLLIRGGSKSLSPLLSLQKGATMRNPDRKNGKAWKKAPKVNRKTGRTVGGYSPAKLAERASKRKG
jgi:hypothetical protein